MSLEVEHRTSKTEAQSILGSEVSESVRAFVGEMYKAYSDLRYAYFDEEASSTNLLSRWQVYEKAFSPAIAQFYQEIEASHVSYGQFYRFARQLPYSGETRCVPHFLPPTLDGELRASYLSHVNINVDKNPYLARIYLQGIHGLGEDYIAQFPGNDFCLSRVNRYSLYGRYYKSGQQGFELKIDVCRGEDRENLVVVNFYNPVDQMSLTHLKDSFAF